MLTSSPDPSACSAIGSETPVPPSGATDVELLARVRDDDASAIGALYDRHAASELHVACLLCGDGERARQLVEDAFLAIWRRPRMDADVRVSLLGHIDAAAARDATLERRCVVLAHAGRLNVAEIGDVVGFTQTVVKRSMRQTLVQDGHRR